MSATFLIDLQHTVQGAASVAPQTIASNTTVNGSGVDLQLSDGPCHAFVITGDAGDGTTTIQVKLQESDTSGGTYTDISGATTTLSGSATANDNLAYAISTNQRLKRWVRAVVITASGVAVSVPIAVAVFARKKIVGGAGYVSV